MATEIPAFGTRIEGQVYVPRPGAYAVVTDERGRVAIVQVGRLAFLPGGGQQAGESPERAAIREVREECGLDVELVDLVGVADEFVYAEAERTHFRKHETFFRAWATGPAGRQVEPDHELIWLTPDEAKTRLSHGSHRWALDRALRG